jgi:hypothetical protein
MYCSSCGVAVAQGLTFCNYCGARLVTSDGESESRQLRPPFLVAVMTGLFILGLPAIVFLIFMLRAALHLDAGIILPFAWFTLLLLTALEGMFAVLLFRRKPRKETKGDSAEFKGPITRELDEMHARALVEPLPSVTEHTTRSFDRVYNERQSK